MRQNLMHSLESLGYNAFFAAQFNRLDRPDLSPARIVSIGRDCCELAGCAVAYSELSGRLRAELSPDELPAVGDWTAASEEQGLSIIHHILERKTALVRRAAGSAAGRQVVAANIDAFFIVTSADRDFNVRRLERYLTAVWDSGAQPIVVLNKIDLESDIEAMMEAIDSIGFGSPVLRVSAATGEGMDDLHKHFGPGKTVGLIGSSGVGKSTLVNRLLASETLKTGPLRNDGRGRHTTTRRELLLLPDDRGMLIDTPGMREIGLTEDSEGIEASFPEIEQFAGNCRFVDCGHEDEPGCAVRAAISSGDLSEKRLESYFKLQREIAAAERLRDPAQQANSKKRWKSIHKDIKKLYKNNPKYIK